MEISRSLPAKFLSAYSKHLPQWNLGDLLSHPKKDLERLSQHISRKILKLESLRNTLTSRVSGQTFAQGLRFAEDVATASSRISAYAQLWFAENTRNQTALAFDAQVKERMTNFANRVLFFDLWWQHLDQQNMRRLIKDSGDFRYYLESLWRLKPHTLSEREERIINVKNSTGRSALGTLYDISTNGFTFTLRHNKTVKSLSREELSAHFRSPSPHVREQAYQELLRVYANNRGVLGELYKSLVRDWKIEGIELRKFTSPIAVRNLNNDVPDQAVEVLLSVCRKNAAVFQEYFRLKSRICGLKPLTRYHIYAPSRKTNRSYPFDWATRTVLDAYHRFSPTLAEHATKVFTNRHIDASPRPGKMGGAFCYSVVPDHTPYVLLNYTGEARDVATLAHELGHAVHSMLASHHTVFTFHPTLPVAETASVFGEMLLSEAFMHQEKNRQVKQSLLLAQLDDIYATVLRQAYFVEFEKRAHYMIAEGATIDALAQSYLRLLREQFGRAVSVPDEFQWEWLSIPHMYRSPFYCYAYSFGNLLVLALYQKYREEGPKFVPKYLDLLGLGGSQSPATMLKTLGVNIQSEQFWQAGFKWVEELVEALENTMR